jgi:hypothetical protein
MFPSYFVNGLIIWFSIIGKIPGEVIDSGEGDREISDAPAILIVPRRIIPHIKKVQNGRMISIL